MRENKKNTIQQTLQEVNQNTDFSVQLLQDCPETIPTLAEWVYADWSLYDRSLTKEKLISNFKSKLSDDEIPLTLVATKDSKPVGVVSLKAHETAELADLENGCLWGGSLHVLPEARNQGIGELLAKSVARIAQRLGYTEIRCYLSEAQGVEWCCNKLGAKILEIRSFRGHSITILSFDLTASSPHSR